MTKLFLIIIALLVFGFIGMFIFPSLYMYLNDPFLNVIIQFIQIVILLVILANIIEMKKKN
ncbi:hypothetical protein HXA34_01060 [Salipaludibacillus agaradhaerens]|jgi:hypothetical protein|uniref:Uncharacterized protein n=1 Tax=Salipaludibacillus agaradhaerens TaxID=76935 RepID=A0A9Q4G0X3_SALAG|nr:hypothetical protein [Salipaludibacillus agaradhaerens]MCR6108942.1 hypothetical protein [Bacillus sp. A301a_S52]UJW56132.1 hypothetical protein HXZ66_01215 [Bacillus sp. A116_S68]MCR6098269.1 hypothetical protein [Salipaludibacillus agaradhaerens]MCR6104875.1 hypothetical protein [Salipaludibacillus agaradhaerens]MCR6116101.1 hypothetical protein [Salipaludibacillus agaradhaerens]